jgi:predicted kinase
VQLNRRLAPDVYLGVADVTGADGALCDALVVMRRMPARRRLSTLVKSGVDVRAGLRALARQLAAFHATARHDLETAAEGSRDAVRERWQASFDQTRPFRGDVLDDAETAEVERLALRYLAGRKRLFFDRTAAGLVRDGHGDLLADARAALEHGVSVVLDASWSDAALRALAVELADEVGADLSELLCVAPAAVAARRLRDRAGDPSDADPAIAAAMAADFAAWPSAAIIDTTGPADACVTDALAAVTRDLRSRPDAVLT